MTASSPPLGFTYQRFESRAEARSAFETALESAQQTLRMFDRDGSFYGLDRPAVVAQIDRLLRLHGQTDVTLIVQQPRHLQSDCVRLRNLQQLHGDRLRVLQVTGRLAEIGHGFALVDESVVLRRPHFDQRLMFWDIDEQAINQAAGVFEELLEQAEPAMSSGTTGL